MRAQGWSPVTLALVALLVPLLAQAQDLPPPPLPPPGLPPAPAVQPPPVPLPEPPAAPMEPVPFPEKRAAPAPAPPAPAPAPPAPSTLQPGPEPFRAGFRGRGGLGLAFLVGDDARLGFGLEGVGEFRFTEHFGVSARLGVGVAHFDRTVAVANSGMGILGGTAEAYGSLWGWATVRDEWALLRLMGGLFASVFLLVGFVVGLVLVVLSPLAAVSFGEVGLLPTLHLPLGAWDLFAEAGLGLMAYAGSSRIISGWGPSLGLGVSSKTFTVRAHVLWAPPGLTDRAGATGAAGMLTVGWGF